jgi:hypothetical protein
MSDNDYKVNFKYQMIGLLIFALVCFAGYVGGSYHSSNYNCKTETIGHVFKIGTSCEGKGIVWG